MTIIKTIEDCTTKYLHVWRFVLTHYNINCKDSVSSHNSYRPHTLKAFLKFIILCTWVAKQVQNVRNSQSRKPWTIQQLCHESQISLVTHLFCAIYIACTIHAYLQKIEHDYAFKQSTSCMQMISGHKVIWRHRNLGCCCDPLVRRHPAGSSPAVKRLLISRGIWLCWHRESW